MTTRIYMPLRSNAAWFGDAEILSRLERQLKVNLVLYDRVILQDGRYQIIAGADGQGIQVLLPSAAMPDRNQSQYFLPGRPFSLLAGGKSLMSSNCDVGYSVDFLPIVRRAGIEGASFIEWVERDVSPTVAAMVSSNTNLEISRGVFATVLPANSFIARHFLEGLYRDSIVAHFLEAPLSVDFRAEPLIDLQLDRAMKDWPYDLPPAFFKYWLNLRLPDLSELGWQELCAFRESEVGKSFRTMVHRICGRFRETPPEIQNQLEMDHWISQEFNKELLAELSARVTSPIQTIVSVLCNFIPYGSIPSVAKNLSDLGRDQDSWVSLVKGASPIP